MECELCALLCAVSILSLLCSCRCVFVLCVLCVPSLPVCVLCRRVFPLAFALCSLSLLLCFARARRWGVRPWSSLPLNGPLSRSLCACLSTCAPGPCSPPCVHPRIVSRCDSRVCVVWCGVLCVRRGAAGATRPRESAVAEGSRQRHRRERGREQWDNTAEATTTEYTAHRQGAHAQHTARRSRGGHSTRSLSQQQRLGVSKRNPGVDAKSSENTSRKKRKERTIISMGR